MDRRTLYSGASEGSAIEINKVLRNTYMLLALTLVFSAITAAIMTIVKPHPYVSIAMLIGGIISMFIVNKKADSASGLIWVFVFAGLLGGSLGNMINHHLQTDQGALVGQALGGTAVIFFSLSGYALVSKKDFSFMHGFLAVGLVVALIAMIANIFFAIPALDLAISALVVLVMSGFILFDTSRIIHGGETNYIRATVGLYLSLYNIFIHLLALLGASND